MKGDDVSAVGFDNFALEYNAKFRVLYIAKGSDFQYVEMGQGKHAAETFETQSHRK